MVNIKDLTMNFKYSLNDQLTFVCYTTPIEVNFFRFSFFYQIISITPTYIKPNTVQTIHFSLKSTKTLLLKTDKLQIIFAQTPQTLILSKQKQYYSFMEFLPNNSEDSFSVLIEKNTMHMATLQTGVTGNIKIPFTNVKPYHLEEMVQTH